MRYANRTLICVLSPLMWTLPAISRAEWTAPPNPDPDAILDQAIADAKSGRFDDALQKHIWFHHHALEHEESLSGVRLSAALMMWHKLAEQHPPALDALKEVRDNVTNDVLQLGSDPPGLRRSFSEVASINKQLGEQDKTVALFGQLDKDAPKVANFVYDIAQPALIKHEKFSLCHKYLEPMYAYARIMQRFQYELDYANKVEPSQRAYQSQLAQWTFLDKGATLVALLVCIDRMDDANLIAKHLLKVSRRRDREKVVAAALEGNFVEVDFEDEPINPPQVETK